MIDYLKASGKYGDYNAHYDDIDLLENRNFDVSDLPSPKDIKGKKKLEYVPRTIRLNEFADTALRSLAEDCDMEINKLVNAIFESYVNKYQAEIGPDLMKERVLNFYLDRVVNELTDEKLESEKKRWERKIRNTEEPDMIEGYGEYYVPFSKSFFTAAILKPKESTKECYIRPIKEEEWQHGEFCAMDYELLIPPKKWFTVMSILKRYTEKCDALNIERHLKEDDLKRLATVINNSKTNKTLVKNLTSALKHSERAFRTEEGSIWGFLS